MRKKNNNKAGFDDAPEAPFVGPELHPGQMKIARAAMESDAFYFTVRCPRQWGKSFFAVQLMLYFAFEDPGCKIMFCSPVYSQASKVYKEMLQGLRDTPAIGKFNSAENSVILSNGTEIFFKSVKVPDNLRGYSVDYLFCDEAAMYPEGVFDAVLKPMLVVRGKKCFLFSTPKGKNYFYRLCMASYENNRYASFKGTYKDNPYANLDEINDAKMSLPENVYRQEYEAEFVDGGGDVFSKINEACILTKFFEPIKGERYYAGIDFGRQDDWTVLTIVDSTGKVVYVYRDRRKDWSVILGNIAVAIKKYNIIFTNAEVNGMGDPLIEKLRSFGAKNVNAFVTNSESKKDVIERLAYALQDGSISLPNENLIPELKSELEDFTYDYSPSTRKVRYFARCGHDDCVMSLALAIDAKEKNVARGKVRVF